MFSQNQRTWQDYVKLAKHYKAIDSGEIWLSDEKKAPWHLVTSLDDGGSVRLGLSVSVQFKALEPKSGLEFRWHLDIEGRNGNGSGHYQIDLPLLRKVRDSLPAEAAKKFSKLIADKAAAVRKNGDEYSEIANKMYGLASSLERF